MELVMDRTAVEVYNHLNSCANKVPTATAVTNYNHQWDLPDATYSSNDGIIKPCFHEATTLRCLPLHKHRTAQMSFKTS